MTKDKKIIRAPILLNAHTVAVIHIFTRHDHLEDCWFSEIEQHEKERHKLYEKAAEQFIEQLEGHWNSLFMEALRNKIDEKLKKDYETILGKN